MLVLALLLVFALLLCTGFTHGFSLIGILILLALIGAGFDKIKDMFW